MKQKSIVKELTTNELVDRISEEKSNLIKLRLNHAVSPIENPAKIKGVRKLIAQLKTELTQRQNANN